MSIVKQALEGAAAVTVPIIDKVKAKVVEVTPVEVKTPVKKAYDATTKFLEDQKKFLSSHDRLKALGGDEIANKYLNNSVEGLADSAAAHADNARLTGNRELSSFQRQLDIESNMTSLRGRFWDRKTNLTARKDVERESFLWMQKAYHAEGNGLTIANHSDPRVMRVVEAYQKSGFAENSLKRMEAAGIDVSNIRKSKNYAPIEHNGHKIQSFVSQSKAAAKAVAEAYGSQIARQYPSLAAHGLTHMQIGNAFLKTQSDSISRVSNTPFHGATMDEVASILDAAGADATVKSQVLKGIGPKLEQAGKAKNLKPRIGWDVDQVYMTADGKSFKLGDFMSHDLEHNLTRYNLTTSARVGLGHKGITTTEMLSSEFNKLKDKSLGNSVEYASNAEYLDNLRDELLGHTVGIAPHALLRAGAQIASALQLKNSGLYNIADYIQSIRAFGFDRTMKAFMKSDFKKVLDNGVNMSPETAEKITDIISGNLRAEGRMKSVVGRMDQEHQAPTSGIYDYINTATQSVHFLNMSEWLRRHHIDLVTGIQADLLEEFAKGGADATKYIKTLKLDPADELLLKDTIANVGLYTDKWDARLSELVSTRLTKSVDDIALQVRKGEIPAYLAHSEAGRLLFPYFTFTSASNQKLLRRANHQDGSIGVAMLMIHQAPAAIIVAMAYNVLNGDAPTEDLFSKALSIAPGIGYGALPLSMADRGSIGGTPTPFAAVNSAVKLREAIYDGDVGKVIKNIPGLAIAAPVRLLTAIFD